jgi:hypothetical protein
MFGSQISNKDRSIGSLSRLATTEKQFELLGLSASLHIRFAFAIDDRKSPTEIEALDRCRD